MACFHPRSHEGNDYMMTDIHACLYSSSAVVASTISMEVGAKEAAASFKNTPISNDFFDDIGRVRIVCTTSIKDTPFGAGTG